MENLAQSHHSAERQRELKTEVIDWIKFLFKLGVAYLILTNTLGITRISGHSMDPTLKDGSFVLIEKVSTYFGSPQYGDVVVIHEKDKQYNIIKRVIGIAGDRVSIKNGDVFVNGSPLAEIYTFGTPNDMKEVIVEKGNVFVLGDNREPGQSLDSRDSDVGTILEEEIQGYATVSLFPFYRIMKPLEL